MSNAASNARSPRVLADRLRGRLGHDYLAHPDLISAVNVALTCEMPLLLTGEAGCGKTDFAFAVARQFAEQAAAQGDERDHGLLDCYVRSDTRARDLLYHYDAIRRFSEAQLRAMPGSTLEADNPARYVELEPLGRALVSPYQRVLLLDEIDKAPRDLPNDLLREIEQRTFTISELPPEMTPYVPRPGQPPLERTMRAPNDSPPPLIIITSNVERQLPEPFLRRCVFYHIGFPSRDDLVHILERHFTDLGGKGRHARIVDAFLTLRRDKALTKPPATAELLAWTRALHALFEDRMDAALGGLLDRLRSAPKGPLRELRWREIPGLPCLVKLKEDLELLGVMGGVAP